jgi:hypothetical protein
MHWPVNITGSIQFSSPRTSGVAYIAGRKGVNGDVRTLMYWAGVPAEALARA